MMNSFVTVRIYIVFTILVAFWCAGILAAPAMKHSGFNGSADMAYTFFSRVCHQSDMRSFHVEGEKFGVCIRCSAIYFGFFFGLVLMPFFGVLKRKSMPKPMLILAVIIPMVVDVMLNDTGLHGSTVMTRVVTGLFFGGGMSWCVVPIFIEACSQIICRKKIHSLDFGVTSYVRKTQ